MGTGTTFLSGSNPVRRWTLVLPREHGAWGILLVSWLTGMAAGASSGGTLGRGFWLLVVACALFCASTPVENALIPDGPLRPRTPGELRWMSLFAAVFSAIAGAALAMLMADPLPAGFFVVGVMATGILEAQIALKIMRRDLRVVAQLTAVLGLTALAAMAYSVATARMDRVALALWAMNGLFATNQMLYVHLRIRQQRTATRRKGFIDKRVFVGCELLTATLLTVWCRIGWIPAAMLIAFVPILMRGAIWCLLPGKQSLNIRRLGKEQLAHGLVFAGILFLAFKISY